MSRRVNSGWLYHSCRQHETGALHQSPNQTYPQGYILDTAGLVGWRNQEEIRMTDFWVSNGITQIPLCNKCRQPRYEGHNDCTCPQNHPSNCDRPTYAELLMAGASDSHDPFTPAERIANSRRIAGDNADFAMRYRNLLQKLLDGHNSDSLALAILSPTGVAEIDAALAWLGD